MRLKAESKYHARKTTVDGITFDSKRESQRYAELRLLEKAGAIHKLECQPAFELHAPGGEVLGWFIADFRYTTYEQEAYQAIVEDCKGMATLPLAKWKQKHLRAEYGITVREIR